MLDYDTSELLAITEQLKQGKIGLFPCDTLLGIISTVTPENIARIQSIKQRSTDPFLILIPNFNTIRSFTEPLTPLQDSYVHSYWPGPITFVFNKAAHLDPAITCNKPPIALRLPNYSPLNFLLAALQEPIISTSANIHGQPPAAEVDTCDPVILDKLDFTYSYHLPQHQRPSTIVDLTVDPPQTLRKGVLSFDSILA